MKKVLSILLAVVLVFGMLPASALNVFAADEGTWTLVTDASTLAAGDQIIVVAQGYNYALSTTQNSNNRGQAGVTKDTSNNTLTFKDTAGVQVITLEDGTISGSFAFKVDNGYLYAASSSKNYLRTETTKSGNSSWKITVTNATTGTASVVAQGSNTRNTMYYNQSSSLFSAYSNAQKPIVLYKFVASGGETACDHVGYDTYEDTDGKAATCTEDGNTATIRCSNCDGEVTASTVIPATGHNYVDGICSVCKEADPDYVDPNGPKASLMSQKPVAGDIIAIYSSGYAMGTAASGTRMKALAVVTVDGQLPYNDLVLQLTVGVDGENYTFKNAAGQYLTSGSTGSSLSMAEELSDLSRWTITEAADGAWYITNVGANYNGTYNQALEYYANDGVFTVFGNQETEMFQMQLYLVEASKCQHPSTTTQNNGEEATCTKSGWTASEVCDSCGETTKEREVIPALGHNYVDGICDNCGETEPAEPTGNRYYIATIRSSGNYFYMTSDLGTASTKRYQAVNSGLTVLPESVAEADAVAKQVFVLIDNGDGTYKIKAEGVEGDANYLGWTSGNSGILVTENEAKALTVSLQDEGYYHISFVNGNETRYLQLNSNSSNNYFAWYTSNQAKNLYLIPVVEAETEPIVEANGNQYTSVEAALAENPGATLKLLTAVESITVDGDLYLDVNGFAATNVTATKIYAYDSTATSAAAGTGSITTSSEVVMDNTVNNIRYIALAEGEEEIKTYTFHVLEMKLSAVTLRANEECGIYYKAVYACDNTLKGKINSYGVVFSLQDMPGADFKTEENDRNLYTAYDKESFESNKEVTSGSIFGIMKKDLKNNADRGKMKIYANAYIIINGVNNDEPLMADVTNAGTTWTEGYTGVAYSLFDVMDKLDEKWSNLSDAQKTTIQNFYNFWASKGMSDWAAELPKIAGYIAS